MKINYKTYKYAPEQFEVKFNNIVVFSTLGKNINRLGVLGEKLLRNSYRLYTSKSPIQEIRKLLFDRGDIGKIFKFDLITKEGKILTSNVINNEIGVRSTRKLELRAIKVYK